MFVIHLIGYVSTFLIAMQVIAYMMQGSIIGGIKTAIAGWKTYISTVLDGIGRLFSK
jgi:hypothetical protein